MFWVSFHSLLPPVEVVYRRNSTLYVPSATSDPVLFSNRAWKLSVLEVAACTRALSPPRVYVYTVLNRGSHTKTKITPNNHLLMVMEVSRLSIPEYVKRGPIRPKILSVTNDFCVFWFFCLIVAVVDTCTGLCRLSHQSLTGMMCANVTTVDLAVLFCFLFLSDLYT